MTARPRGWVRWWRAGRKRAIRSASSAASTVLWPLRRATWRYRALPSLLIIGAQKAGTTSLFHYLSQHPQLRPAHRKEVHFFDGGVRAGIDHYSRGEAWYRAQFPIADRRSRALSFEASPLYLYHPLAPGRIRRLLPDVKLIALLRDPAERAVSNYFHEVRRGFETLPLMAALRAEEERLEAARDGSPSFYKSDAFIRHSYKTRGRYAEQLGRYLELFPAARLLVLESEMLFANPGPTLRRVFGFLGVDEGFAVPNLEPRLVGRNKRDPGDEVTSYLHRYFEQPNDALYELIGESFDW